MELFVDGSGVDTWPVLREDKFYGQPTGEHISYLLAQKNTKRYRWSWVHEQETREQAEAKFKQYLEAV